MVGAQFDTPGAVKWNPHLILAGLVGINRLQLIRPEPCHQLGQASTRSVVPLVVSAIGLGHSVGPGQLAGQLAAGTTRPSASIVACLRSARSSAPGTWSRAW